MFHALRQGLQMLMNAKSFQRRSKLHRYHCFDSLFYPAVMTFEEVHIPLTSENKRESTSHWLVTSQICRRQRV